MSLVTCPIQTAPFTDAAIIPSMLIPYNIFTNETCSLYDYHISLAEKTQKELTQAGNSQLKRYQKNYQDLFSVFLRHTNEKEATLQKLEKKITHLFQTIFKQQNDEMVISDLGFGTGEFTSTFAERVRHHLSSSTRLKVMGIEKRPVFVSGAKQIFKNKFSKSSVIEDLREGNFFDEQMPKDYRRRSSIIMISHALYDHANAQELYSKIASLAHPKGGVAIFIHENSSQVDEFLKRHANVLHTRIKDDCNASIEKGLKATKAFVNFTKETIEHEISFPTLTKKEWKRLRTLPYGDYENDYAHESKSWQNVKKLMEFFFQQPLEGIHTVERARVLKDFRQLLAANNHRLEMTNQIFVADFHTH